MNNRDLATIIIGAVVILAIGIYATRNRGVQESLKGIQAAFISPKVLIPILGIGGWVLGLILLSKQVGLWDNGLTFAAILWAATTGLGLIFKLATRKKGEPFFRPALVQTLRLTALVEVIVGLFAFSLGLELALLVVVSFLGMLSAVADSDAKYEPAKKLLDGLFCVMGLAIIALTVVSVISGWDELDKAHVLRQLALPLWLTLGAVPYLYVLALWISYEQAFLRINLASDDRAARRRAKLALIAALHGRAAKANSFVGGWAHEMTESQGVVSAWCVGRKFLRAEQKRVDEQQKVAERLKHHTGVEGADDEGRRLDQREFKETKDAFFSLATAQMGWHNQKGRYRADLLDFFPLRHLPEDHGIQMAVAKDGRRWFAWRRTVTGWCFGIGASKEPPDQWLYDGAEPPTGFPGRDPVWGDQFGIEMENW